MKTKISLFLIALFSSSLFGQTDYDCVNWKEVFLLKSSADQKNSPNIRSAEIRSLESVDQLFGSNYKSRDHMNLIDDQVYTTLTYSDGMELELLKSRGGAASFAITSDNYKLVLGDGKEIMVGMSGCQLEAIFPKSYSKRSVYTDPDPRKGKASFIVYFSFVRDNKIYYVEERIIFILSSKDGVLETFFTFRPQ